jgi:hypothetical protein
MTDLIAVALSADELSTISAALDFYYEEFGAPESVKALAKRFNNYAERAEQPKGSCPECFGTGVVLLMPDENDESKDYEVPCEKCSPKA